MLGYVSVYSHPQCKESLALWEHEGGKTNDDSLGFHIFKTTCFLELLTHLWCVSTYVCKIKGKDLVNLATKIISEIQVRRTYVDEKAVEQ